MRRLIERIPEPLRKLLLVMAGAVLFLTGLSQIGNPETTARYIVLSAAPAQLVFWLLYTFKSPFWLEPLGRALWIKSTALMLLLTLPTFVYFFGVDYLLREEVRVVIYGLAWLGIYGQTWQLIRLQKKERDLIGEAKRELASREDV